MINNNENEAENEKWITQPDIIDQGWRWAQI